MSRIWNRAAALAVLGFGMAGLPAVAGATATSSSCAAAVDAATSAWNAAGYATPSKPGQSVVMGRSGHAITGGQYNYAVTQLRLARQDCAGAKPQSSVERVAEVEKILGGSGQ